MRRALSIDCCKAQSIRPVFCQILRNNFALVLACIYVSNEAVAYHRDFVLKFPLIHRAYEVVVHNRLRFSYLKRTCDAELAFNHLNFYVSLLFQGEDDIVAFVACDTLRRALGIDRSKALGVVPLRILRENLDLVLACREIIDDAITIHRQAGLKLPVVERTDKVEVNHGLRILRGGREGNGELLRLIGINEGVVAVSVSVESNVTGIGSKRDIRAVLARYGATFSKPIATDDELERIGLSLNVNSSRSGLLVLSRSERIAVTPAVERTFQRYFWCRLLIAGLRTSCHPLACTVNVHLTIVRTCSFP